MIYKEIFQVLNSNDSFLIMMLGVIIAFIVGIKIKNIKKNVIGLGVCFCVFVISGIIPYIVFDFLLIIIMISTGVLAIGGMIGFLLGIIVLKNIKKIEA